jgi:hypothetical protein
MLADFGRIVEGGRLWRAIALPFPCKLASILLNPPLPGSDRTGRSHQNPILQGFQTKVERFSSRVEGCSSIKRATNTSATPVEDMGVDHGGFDIFMSQ